MSVEAGFFQRLSERLKETSDKNDLFDVFAYDLMFLTRWRYVKYNIIIYSDKY